MSFRFSRRVDGVRDWLASQTDAKAVLITNLEHVKYITGFTGSNGIALISKDFAVFITDGRYLLQASVEVTGFETRIVGQAILLLEAARVLTIKGFTGGLAIESNTLSVDAWNTLIGGLPSAINLVPASGIVEPIKAIKEPQEIDAIRRACALVDEACTHITEIVKTGMTEAELAWRIEVYVRERGAVRMGFDSIIGSGPNAAIIHGRAGNRGIGSSGEPEFLLCDFGCEIDGYNSDITRTYVFGEPSARQREIWQLEKAAQAAAFAKAQIGVACGEVDTAARAVLAAGGLSKDYDLPGLPHRTGHGIGLDIHEWPYLVRGNPQPLLPGMCFSNEPMICLEGEFGVRLEDHFYMTEQGPRWFTEPAYSVDDPFGLNRV